MTPDAVRDKLAELRGWEKHRSAGSTKEDGEDGLYWKRKGRMTWDHPIPNTLDEAAKLPEGYRAEIIIAPNVTRAVAWKGDAPMLRMEPRGVATVYQEGPTELEARFRLRLACELAEKEKQ